VQFLRGVARPDESYGVITVDAAVEPLVAILVMLQLLLSVVLVLCCD
jgi:hypothetical protein